MAIRAWMDGDLRRLCDCCKWATPELALCDPTDPTEQGPAGMVWGRARLEHGGPRSPDPAGRRVWCAWQILAITQGAPCAIHHGGRQPEQRAHGGRALAVARPGLIAARRPVVAGLATGLRGKPTTGERDWVAG